jgi:enterochelin esterase family protein
MYASWQEMEITITENNITIKSDMLKRDVECTLLMPEDSEITEPLNLLLLNDGQEAESLQLRDTLEDLMSNNRIKPVLVVAIHAGDERLLEYGF